MIAGYSMGGAVAQLVWRQHPDRVAGLVLCSTARNYRGAPASGCSSRCSRRRCSRCHGTRSTRVERMAATLPEMPSMEIAEAAAWGRAEFRSTSAWSMPEVLGELGRFNSADWIGEVDVPDLGRGDGLGPHHPRAPAAAAGGSIEGATVYEAPGGHASIVLG